MGDRRANRQLPVDLDSFLLIRDGAVESAPDGNAIVNIHCRSTVHQSPHINHRTVEMIDIIILKIIIFSQ